MNSQFPFEIISNIASVIILISLFLKYNQYKKKLEVLKNLNELKEKRQLTVQDKEFIEKNYKDYKNLLEKNEERLKVVYPIFILIAGILLAFLPLQIAFIHLNVIVVLYIFMHVTKLHNKNFVTFLKGLREEN